MTDIYSSDDPPITIEEHEVRSRFKAINPRKASGPDGVSGRVLKTCASQLAIPYHMIFQMSINEMTVPRCWKESIITPVPKNKRPTANNDFRPIALTSIVMMCLERIVMRNLLGPLREHIDTNLRINASDPSQTQCSHW